MYLYRMVKAIHKQQPTAIYDKFEEYLFNDQFMSIDSKQWIA